MKALTKQQINALYRCTSNEKTTPVLSGVYYENGKMVATDSYILITIDAEYPKENEGKIIDKKGKVIDGRFPKYETVFPCGGELVQVASKQLYRAVKNIRTIKAQKINGAVIKINDGYFNAKLLHKLLDVVKNKNFEMQTNGKYKGAIIQGENFKGLIMPKLVEDENEVNSKNLESEGTKAIFTIEEALEYINVSERKNNTTENKSEKIKVLMYDSTGNNVITKNIELQETSIEDVFLNGENLVVKFAQNGNSVFAEIGYIGLPEKVEEYREQILMSNKNYIDSWKNRYPSLLLIEVNRQLGNDINPIMKARKESMREIELDNKRRNEELEDLDYNTESDWENFLRTDQSYYVVK